jgi:hypothetical protein
MPIPREYATSNPEVREELARIPIGGGTHVGEFVAPDFPIDAEVVDTVSMADHKLNLDDMRSEDAPAKTIRFEEGDTDTISIVERALKTTIGSRKIEEAGKRGVNLVADRLALLRDDILDAKEYRRAQLVMTAANYGGTHKANAKNFRTASLISEVDAAKDVIIDDGHFEPRFGLIGRAAWRAVRRNAEFREFAGGSDQKAGASDLTLKALAEFLDLDEIVKASFYRIIGNDAAPTQFWTTDSFLVFHKQKTLSSRTLAQTAVCPYGKYQNIAEGTLVDARTEPLPGTDRLTEAGAYHRYKVLGCNFDLGFLFTGIVDT